MGWEQRSQYTYYYRKVWRAGRVYSEYIGRGPAAALLGAVEAYARALRAQARQALQAQQLAFAAPAALTTYTQEIRAVVRAVLHALGFHQHHGTWRRKRMQEITRSSGDAALVAAHAIYAKAQPSAEELAAFRRILDEQTIVAQLLGDTARLARQQLLQGFQASPALAAAVEARMLQITASLGYAEASELERLLIDEVALCWLDHHRMAIAAAKSTSGALSVRDLERWERLLASKQARYLKAIETLARVRRLLKLPAVQVNIATEGGQQVNVQGSMLHGAAHTEQAH